MESGTFRPRSSESVERCEDWAGERVEGRAALEERGKAPRSRWDSASGRPVEDLSAVFGTHRWSAKGHAEPGEDAPGAGGLVPSPSSEAAQLLSATGERAAAPYPWAVPSASGGFGARAAVSPAVLRSSGLEQPRRRILRDPGLPVRQRLGGWSLVLSTVSACIGLLPLLLFPLCVVMILGSVASLCGVLGLFIPGNRRRLALMGLIGAPLSLVLCCTVQWYILVSGLT